MGAAALGKAAREGDLRVVLDVEEVRAPQMRIPSGLARPHPGRVDDAFKRRVEASLPIEPGQRAVLADLVGVLAARAGALEAAAA